MPDACSFVMRYDPSAQVLQFLTLCGQASFEILHLDKTSDQVPSKPQACDELVNVEHCLVTDGLLIAARASGRGRQLIRLDVTSASRPAATSVLIDNVGSQETGSQVTRMLPFCSGHALGFGA